MWASAFTKAPTTTVALTEGAVATWLGYPGPNASLPLPAPRVSVAAGMVEATLPCGGHATAILGNPIQVYRVFRNGSPPGSGSVLMAAVLKAAGFLPGQDIILRNIINAPTRQALANGTPLSETLIGNLTIKALSMLDSEVSSMETFVKGATINGLVKTK